MPKRLTDEEFRKRMLNINPDIIVIGKYSGSSKKIECQCKLCNSRWFPVPDTLYAGHGCPTCAGYKRRSNDDFISEISERNPNIKVIGEFCGVEKKVKCQCKICGDIFDIRPTVLLRGGGCPACAGNKKKTTDSFIIEMQKINSNVEILGDYKNLLEPIECRCKICGDIWSATPKNLLKGHGCALCAHNKKWTTCSFKMKMRELNPEIEILGEYTNNSSIIKCRCKICGNIWNKKPQHLLRGQGCPECYHSSTSFMEKFIGESFAHVLGENQILYRDKAKIGAEIDIFIPSLNIGIEPGSFYWHQNRLKKDYDKQRMAKDKGIRLIIVYDACNSNIEKREDVWVYKKDLGADITGNSLQNLVLRLFSEVGITVDWSEQTWAEITKSAYVKSRRKTTESFKKELYQINPYIEVLGEYKKSNSKIKCRCITCGHIWEPNTEGLLMGHGCPKCAFRSNGTRSSKRVLCITTGEEFESLTEAAQKYGGHTSAISRCCMGKQKTSCGFEWMYI